MILSTKGGPENYITAVRKKLEEIDPSYQAHPAMKKRKDEKKEDQQGIYLLNILQGHKDPITRIRWSPDGLKLASASTDSTIRIWETETGDNSIMLTGHENWILVRCTGSPNGTGCWYIRFGGCHCSNMG